MIHACILHHPAREIHPSLMSWMLEPGDGPVRSVRTVTEGNTVWEATKFALEHLEHCPGHALIMHDDMIPCQDFSQALEYFQNTHPYKVLSLWHNWSKPDGYLGSHLFAPAGAFLIPCHQISEILAWQETYVRPDYRCDDTRIACWAAATGRSIWVPYPSLVQHDPTGSIARPGQICLRSPTFGGHWRETQDVALPIHRADQRNFLISRNFHFVPPYDSGRYWQEADLG